MNYKEVGKEVLNTELEGLKELKKTFDHNFDKAIKLLKSRTGRIFLTGIGKSSFIAQKIAATMSSTGTPAMFVHPAEASHGDLGMINLGDVIIMISNSGESKELFDIINFAKRNSNPLIAITSKSESTLAKHSDIIIKLPKHKEACPLGLAPTTSTTMTMVLGDAISIALYKDSDFNHESFSNFHPGGKLGRKLYKVSDLAHYEPRVPFVYQKSSFIDTVLEMSNKGFGVVGVLHDINGTLEGIITDGDIRRHIDGIENKTAGEIMTLKPKKISEDVLAAEALKVMIENKITSLFITDKYWKPKGILHIHDCLTAGVDE